jgi:hypothetical protein
MACFCFAARRLLTLSGALLLLLWARIVRVDSAMALFAVARNAGRVQVIRVVKNRPTLPARSVLSPRRPSLQIRGNFERKFASAQVAVTGRTIIYGVEIESHAFFIRHRNRRQSGGLNASYAQGIDSANPKH